MPKVEKAVVAEVGIWKGRWASIAGVFGDGNGLIRRILYLCIVVISLSVRNHDQQEAYLVVSSASTWDIVASMTMNITTDCMDNVRYAWVLL